MFVVDDDGVFVIGFDWGVEMIMCCIVFGQVGIGLKVVGSIDGDDFEFVFQIQFVNGVQCVVIDMIIFVDIDFDSYEIIFLYKIVKNQDNNVLVVLMMFVIVKLNILNSWLVGVDLLKWLMLIIVLCRLMYLCQKFGCVVLMVMCFLQLLSIDVLQLVFWWLKMLVQGIEMMWVVMFLLVNVVWVLSVSLILELVVMKVIWVLLVQLDSMQLFLWMLLFEIFWVIVGRFWCDRVSKFGLLVWFIVVVQVMVVLVVLVGCQMFRFGMMCKLGMCLIGWCVGLFLLRLMELWVQIMIWCCFISVVMWMVLWV